MDFLNSEATSSESAVCVNNEGGLTSWISFSLNEGLLAHGTVEVMYVIGAEENNPGTGLDSEEGPANLVSTNCNDTAGVP
jgi:hypothetical protein